MGGRTGWKNWINAGARLVLLAAGVYGCLLLLRSSDGIACSPWAVYGGDGRTVSAPVAFRRQGKRLCAGSVGTAPSRIRGGTASFPGDDRRAGACSGGRFSWTGGRRWDFGHGGSFPGRRRAGCSRLPAGICPGRPLAPLSPDNGPPAPAPLLWDRYRAGAGAAPGPLSACVLGPAHGGDGQEAVFLWRRRPARYSFGSPPPASPGSPCICGDLPEAPTGTAIGRRRTTAACSLIFRTRWAGGPGGPGSMACFPVCTSCSTVLRRQRGGRSL